MRKLCLFFIFLIVSTFMMAVPADRTPKSVRLTDGRTIEVYLIGDEYYSWLQTADGFVVEQTENGLYELTTRRASDEVNTAQAARRKAYRSEQAPLRVGSQATAPLPSIGSPRVPVVLVNFADSVFTVGQTDEEIRHYYDLYCNGTRDGNLYQGHGSYGAIRDYFSDQSDGQFTPEFTIFGPVTVSKDEAYYGQKSGTVKDKYYNAFVKEAIDSVSRKFEVDWSLFDNKGVGKVDMVFLIFAGCGENSSGNENHIWPNERSIGTVKLQDGRSLTFVCSGCCSEKSMRNRTVDGRTVKYTVPDGIGVMCHELSHALGLPDFYDTNYKAFGMDLWSLMDYGCYAGNGNVPCAYTAYEREFMGWSSTQTLYDNGELVLKPISDGGIGYKIINEENPHEFYIIENRQAVNWDRSLGRMGHGLQVTHVDYDKSCWSNNRVNTDSIHQRMTIIAANNEYLGSTALQTKRCTQAQMLHTWAGNLYPFVEDGVLKNDSLTAYSTPAATVYSPSGFMNKDLHAIRENSDLTVSLYFGNDYVDALDKLKADGMSTDNRIFDLSGRPVDASSPLRPGIYIQNNRKRYIK